ncbi:MAG: aliphatic sulfonate ABC transporter substrate-binding protein [Deltaproteobacteria bacterium]|jgi:sulfonate transport system substrate-binding protein|nr:aliphatic sulfonate ABC transporter substrate-binding protein [Deltaproteobacteria bacterium]
MIRTHRISIFKTGLSFVLLTLLLFTSTVQAKDSVLRIGFQKSSSLLILLKGQGILEKALQAQGVTVSWHEFTSGLPMVEALNVGALDLSADVADTVPLFAQASGTEFTYFLQEKASPTAEALVVLKNSPIQTVADLKGKKLAVAKASGAHYLTVAALNKAGLVFGKDVQVSYLQPADARVALESGAVDAWTTWDPFLATIQIKSGARIIADGKSSGVSYTRFYPISSVYLKNNPQVAQVLADELLKIGKWVKSNPEEAAKVHAPLVGLDIEIVKLANSRRSYNVAPVDKAAIAEQQKIADLFVAEKLLVKPIKVNSVPLWVGK